MVCEQVINRLWIEMPWLTFIRGHVPQGRVAGIGFALTFIKTPFNPALCKSENVLFTLYIQLVFIKEKNYLSFFHF